MIGQNGGASAVAIGPSEFPGSIVVNVIALVSAMALVLVALRAGWLALRFCFECDGVKRFARESFFFRTRMGAYAACILVGNLFSSVAGVIGLSWVAQRQIAQGPMCTAQAIFMSMGNIAGAYFTVALGVHTFNSLVLRYRQSAWFGAFIIAGGWVLALTLAMIPLSPALATKSSTMYGPGQVTCGIQSIYVQMSFYHHLLPIFLAALLSAILYSLIFLAIRGFLNFRGGISVNLVPTRKWNGRMGTLEDYHRFVLAVVRSMLWFPAAYILLLLPYSFTRLLMLSGFRVSSAAMMFAFACWYLLGVVNVLILYNTFRLLVPATDSRSMTSKKTNTSSFRAGSIPKLGGQDDVENQDNASSTAQTKEPPILVISAQQRSSIGDYASDRDSATSGDGLISRVYRPRTISEPNEIIDDVPFPPPVMLRDRADQVRLVTPLATRGLPSAPRATRSPIVRHPTIEDLRSVSEANAVFPRTDFRDGDIPKSRIKSAFEHEIFGVPPRPHSGLDSESDYSEDDSTSTASHGTVIRRLPPIPKLALSDSECHDGVDPALPPPATKYYF